MTLLDTGLEIPATARYHRGEIEEILRAIQEGTYVAVLGPRLSGKTVLLRYVDHVLAEQHGYISIYIDLMDIQAPTLQRFFSGLMHQAAGRFHDRTGMQIEVPEESVISSAVFRGLICELIEVCHRNVVLIIEHLEAVPVDLVQALLTSLRAAYMDQQGMDSRATVVVSGALSLATLTVGESSPFRGIAERVFIGDLSEGDSLELIREYLDLGGVSATRQAMRRLLRGTVGDQYLIRKICQRSINLARVSSSNRLRTGNVNQIISDFVREDLTSYAPLLEAVSLIEEDPDLLQCILLLLEQGIVHKSRLPLPLSPDLDPLYLTGVVEQVDGGSYRLQNQIYRKFLIEYFHPGRVGRTMAAAGRWDQALDYLENGVDRGDEMSGEGLLAATVNAIYAAEDLEHAAHFLGRGLLSAFSIEEVQVWYGLPAERSLRLIGQMGAVSDSSLWENPQISTAADRLEARAFRQAASLRGTELGDRIHRAIPLMLPGRSPMGVVTLYELMQEYQTATQRERDRRLSGYMNQAARAFQAVITRRQELTLAGQMQASLLTGRPPEIVGWGIAAHLNPARETSGDFYDFIPLVNGRLGILIADVSDKGMGAALYMALTRTLIRTYAPDYPDEPERVMKLVSDRILADTLGGMFVTAFYGVLDPVSGQLNYCNAGHNPPFLFSAGESGSPVELRRTGMALGVEANTAWGASLIEFQNQSLLVLYTDGVVDVHDPHGVILGEDRLVDMLVGLVDRSAGQVKDALMAGLRTYAGDGGQFDDIALVVVKREAVIPVRKVDKPVYGRDVL